MESFIILGILIIALFLFSWNKMEQTAEQADERYLDEKIKRPSSKKD